MDKKFSIRLAMPEDKDDLERLTRDLLAEKGEEFVEKRYEWGMLRRLYDPLQRHGIFVTETLEEKKIVGMIFGELKIDPTGETECHVKQLFVDRVYRGQSIGKTLLENLIQHLKKINVKQLKVNLHMNSVKTKSILNSFNFQPRYTVMELKLDTLDKHEE